MNSNLVYAPTRAAAEEYRDQGYEPIECSFGRTSVVGKLGLDHHGALSEKPPVSLQAFQLLHNNGRRLPKRYVVTGQPDADSIYALLLLTHQVLPSYDLAQAIAELDMDPVGRNQTDERYLKVAAFRGRFPTPQRSLESYRCAIQIGKNVFTPYSLPRSAVAQAVAYESLRGSQALRAQERVADDVALVTSNVDSRDLWHRHFASLVVQYKPGQEVVSLSGCSKHGVERLKRQGIPRQSVHTLIGERGFHDLYPSLDSLFGEGSGGHATVGGLSRERMFSFEDAERVWNFLRDFVRFTRPRKSA